MMGETVLMVRRDRRETPEMLVREVPQGLPEQMEMMDKEAQPAQKGHRDHKEIQVRQAETEMMEETDRTELLAQPAQTGHRDQPAPKAHQVLMAEDHKHLQVIFLRLKCLWVPQR